MEEQIVELLNENDEVERFVHLMTVEHDGAYYLVMLPEDQTEEEEGLVLIMSMRQDEQGNDIFEPVMDEALATTIYEQFIELMDEEGTDADESADEEEDT